MKVILLKDVPKLGRKYDIKEVNDGYALNFLIPQKMVELATPGKLAEAEKKKKEFQIEKNQKEESLVAALKQVAGLELVIKVKASEKGHLFSSVHKKDIAEKMKRDYQVDIAEEAIILDEPIKSLGEFEILVKIKDKKTSFKLIVEKE